MAEFRMPSLGSDMDAGTLVKWRCAPGDRIVRGTIVAEVETDKGIIEVEAYEPGVVERLLVQPGARVPVGVALAELRDAPEGAIAPPRVTQPAPATAPTSTVAPRIAMSPLARRRAREAGIDPSTVRGTGPHGAVTVRDLEALAAVATPSTRMRRAIAATMSRAKREIPHYYLATSVDLTAALRWIGDRNSTRAPALRILPGLLFVRAAARAVAKVPEINGRWSAEQDEAAVSREVNVGVAVSLRGGGLVAPAIRDTASIALDDLVVSFRDAIQRARAGTLRSTEMSDGTLTVTSLGDRGVETVFPIIIPPQLAILGFGKIVERPWAVDGMLAVRSIVHVTLGGDHRATDGHRGALYLDEVARLLGSPEELA